MKIIVMVWIVNFFIIGASAHACENHGGFGGPAWSHYGREIMSPINNGYSAAHKTVVESAIVLDIPSLLAAKQGQETELRITYRDTSDEEASGIQLSIDTGPEILTLVDEVSLLGKTGEHSFHLTPTNTGTYRIRVSAKYINQPGSTARHQVIYLNVST